jgi:hypothetical protein
VYIPEENLQVELFLLVEVRLVVERILCNLTFDVFWHRNGLTIQSAEFTLPRLQSPIAGIINLPVIVYTATGIWEI